MKNNKTDWLTLIVWFGLISLTVLFWTLMAKLKLLQLAIGIATLLGLILLMGTDNWAVKGKD